VDLEKTDAVAKHRQISAAGIGAALLFLLILAGVLLAKALPPHDQLRIVAGSGFSTFEPILKRWGDENHVDVRVTYKGSLDIMLLLEKGTLDYDAVWDGDSLWTSMGDKGHILKDGKSIMCSPIVFGVKKSLAQQLGWVGRDVRMQEILDAAERRRLRVLMTSATQSNTGASAYFGFLYAFAGQPDVLTAGNLNDPAVVDRVKRILSTVNRTSDSSGWMRDLFLSRYDHYDAMFNYESHVLEMNQKLVERGDEPLYIVYPVEGLGMADFPFSFVSQGNDEAEPLFKKLQAYLLSPDVQAEIAARGRRTGALCNQIDPAIFRPEWGADARRVINSFRYPSEPVIWQALRLYQTAYRKPSFTVFALDFSGSMEGKGKEELTKAMRTLLDQQTSAKYLLLASPEDVTAVVVFDDTLMNDPEAGGWIVRGNDPGALNDLLGKIERQPVGHFTDIYLPVERALQLMKTHETGNAFPAIILMTDGQSNRGKLEDVKRAMAATGLDDVPVYGITFGDADANQLNAVADATAGRVFDGTKDLIGAFRKAKGQN
jgi:Ca-activated chloride channel homolog